MRIHTASASSSVTRTLDAIITASGHEISTMGEAELILVDGVHPPLPLSPPSPHLWLVVPPVREGTMDGEPLPRQLHPQHLIRLLRHRKAISLLVLGHGWALDCTARALVHADFPSLALTEKECALMQLLVRAQPLSITREALLEQIWGIHPDIDTHTAETHIYRLRHKLAALTPNPCDIVTEDGAYKIAGISV